MTDPSTTVFALELATSGPDEADLAAVAFLARYNGRTLDAYRHDLREFFQWTATTAWHRWRQPERTSSRDRTSDAGVSSRRGCATGS